MDKCNIFRWREGLVVIKIKNVGKSYDGKKMVIEDINLEIKKGEFFVLLGPSGCGKSTLLRMIAGLEKMTTGDLWINGVHANELEPKDRQLSMVFQNYALFPHMTVRENILFGLDVKKVPKDEQEERLREVSEIMGLSEYLKRKPGQLSGGQRQRVALARSICSQAPICLMDEPLSNLDAKLRGQMRSEIKRIQKMLGLTIVYVTHDQVEAMTMGDRIMILNEGHIQQVGEPLEVYNCPANKLVATFIGTPQMNIFNAKIENDKMLLDNNLVLNMNHKKVRHFPKGDFYIGVRAEHLSKMQEESDYTIEVEATSVEYTGDETQIFFQHGNQFAIAKWFGQIPITVEHKISLGIQDENLYVFDKGSGKIIA